MNPDRNRNTIAAPPAEAHASAFGRAHRHAPGHQSSALRPPPQPWAGIILRVLLLMVLMLGLLAVPMACTTRIIPPAHLVDPVLVYLVDHGSTASIVLPDEHGQLARFAYGDWNYYALGNKGIFSGIAALLWPTRGTLGKQPIASPATPDDIRAQTSVENLYPLHVERDKALELRRKLDEQHREHLDTLVHNPHNQLKFVHHPRRYTYFHNSNHEVARWLRALGARTRGPAYTSRWRVDPLQPQRQAPG